MVIVGVWKRRLDFDDESRKEPKREAQSGSGGTSTADSRNVNNSRYNRHNEESRPRERSTGERGSGNGGSDRGGSSGGLNTAVHPLLRDLASVPQAAKQGPKRQRKPRSIFDPASLNPYLNQGDVSGQSHKPRPLQLNPQGKYVAQGEQLRERLKKEKEEEEYQRQLASKNLLPDENLGEQLYKPQWPPLIESWDRPYLQTRSYDDFKGEFVYDDEEAPVSIYVQHPVPVSVHRPEVESALHLTKKELKRKRLKLSNLMNVLTNEAIKDPTGVEMKVREQVEERHRQHMKANEERQLTPEQRHEKTKERHERDLGRGVFTTVYRIDSLENGQHQYKVDVNAKQMDLYGMVLYNPRFNLVILSLITLGSVVAIACWPQQKKAKEEVIKQTTEGPKPGDQDELYAFQKIINDFTKDEK
ncbi:hypothetical protein CXQ85_004057 [Candidozyma haemuli]|uniref:Uncharacterized protein n=1 Tax=Candidozyma haemuli TaxID=45357 RepID=A0A2V1B123_9ASCO|nr:hypothetical protein CXQ85_004057 [[Candida] haemuloni]PVH23764.1 hypothetical protein CXQ85_004057 [[Candida] haemuloni]